MCFVQWKDRTGAERMHHPGLAQALVLSMIVVVRGATMTMTMMMAGGAMMDGIVGGGTCDDLPAGGHLPPSNH